MDIFVYLDAMLPFIERREWDALEEKYEQVAVDLAGLKMASIISTVDTTEYAEELYSAMESAYFTVAQKSYKAIYFEYDLDNSWQGNFFFYKDYEVAPTDIDWPCYWEEDNDGPEFRSFGNIYNSTHGFDSTDEEKGTTLYLIARTVAVFGRCSQNFLNNPCALYLGYHEQNPIVRLKDFSE